MYRISREIDFCYGHRLLNHNGKCRHLHGHNGRLLIILETSQLDDLGMVVDFADIKQVLGTWIDRTLDHRMILHHDDPLASVLQQHEEPVYLMKSNPTAENIAQLIFDYAVSQQLPVIEVQLFETPHCYASYRCPTG